MERKPKPMRTLNHLQMPEPCRGWDSFSALGESPAGSSPGFAPGERPTEPLSRGAGGAAGPPRPSRPAPSRATRSRKRKSCSGCPGWKMPKKSPTPPKSRQRGELCLHVCVGISPGNEGGSCQHDPGSAWSGNPKSVSPSKTLKTKKNFKNPRHTHKKTKQTTKQIAKSFFLKSKY